MDAEPKKIRAFIAVKPPPDWLDHLGSIIAGLRGDLRASSIAWVDPEKIHITFRFLGGIYPEQVSNVVSAMSDTASAVGPFTITAAGLGCFPSPRRPRVIWAGIRGAEETIAILHKQITEGTRGIGEPPDDRPFTPHLTLARVKQFDRRDLAALEKAFARPTPITSDWRVTEILLMRSHLAPTGARYEILNTAPLNPKREAR